MPEPGNVLVSDVVRPFTARRVAGRRLPAWAGVTTDRVYVLFTSIEETLAAVPVASRLAEALHSRLTVLHFRAIAFGAPLDSPSGVSPLETEDFRERLAEQASDAEVRVCICRDAQGALSSVLKGRSLVLLGRRRRWWPTAADRWRRTLEAAGHLVVVVDGATHA